MSLARKIAREQAAPYRKHLTKALQRARRDARMADLADLAEGPIADVSDFTIDDLAGVEINTLRTMAGAAFVTLVLLYTFAWAVSGC